jgi:hypothetical protein
MSGSKVEGRMVGYEAGKTFTLEFTSGPVKGSKLTYSVEQVDGKTRLTTDLEMRLHGVWKVMYPVLIRRRIRDRAWGVMNVKRILEGPTSSDD